MLKARVNEQMFITAGYQRQISGDDLIGALVVVHFVRHFAEIIPTDILMVKLPELAVGTQHSQIHLWPKQFDLSHYPLVPGPLSGLLKRLEQVQHSPLGTTPIREVRSQESAIRQAQESMQVRFAVLGCVDI
jgi:hypothetical protein